MHQSSPLPWLVAVPTCPHGCTQPMVPPACPLHCPSLPRQTGVGLCSMSARLAGIIAPLVLLLDRYHPAIPMAIFGSVTVVVGLFCFLLPETRGTDLADDTRDGCPPAQVRIRWCWCCLLGKDVGHQCCGRL